MPLWKALKKCPTLVLLPVEMDKYRAVSQSILQIFKQYTTIIEPLSLDEAYLDVTNTTIHNTSTTLIAKAIRDDIFQQENITASAGVSFNKFLAKIASDWNKPNGQYTIKPEDRDKFISALPVSKVYGVGRVTAQKLNRIDVYTCANLQALDIGYLIDKFGKQGKDLYYLSRGIDNREVQVPRPVKSLSVEETYEAPLNTLEECKDRLIVLYNRLVSRLDKNPNNIIGGSFVKLKFPDFSRITVERKTTSYELNNFMELTGQALKSKDIKIRLIGIGVRFTEKVKSDQLEFHM
jgi:DNA polymerase-4